MFSADNFADFKNALLGLAPKEPEAAVTQSSERQPSPQPEPAAQIETAAET